MSAISIHIGDRFGRLVVSGRGPNKSNGQPRWACQCDCGGSNLVGTSDLRQGKVKGCGCLMRTHALRHGHARTKSHTSVYKAWTAMRARCMNAQHPSFPEYGGRGIGICDRWNDFECFLRDLGERPSSRHSIDRIDVNGNYEPGNVRWATPADQARNRRTNVLTHAAAEEIRRCAQQGESRRSLRERFGVSKGAIQSVLENRSWKCA